MFGSSRKQLKSCLNCLRYKKAKSLKQEIILEKEQRDILELIAFGAPLERILTRIIAQIEALDCGVYGSVLLFDPNDGRLHHGSAPRLPQEYNEFVNGLAIGPDIGSCGAAAFLRTRVIVRDIAKHRNWRNFKDVALRIGLRSCWSSPIFSSAGEVLGTFAVYRKIPSEPNATEIAVVDQVTRLAAIAIENHNIRRSLQISEKRYRVVTESVADMILGIDKNGTIVFANNATRQMCGYRPEEIIGQHLRLLIPRYIPLDCEVIISELLQTRRNPDHRTNLIFQLQTKDLTSIAAEFVFNEYEDDGKIYYYGVIRDVTERQKYQHELAEAKSRAENAVQAKSNFIAGMNHELRTPLTCIIGYTDYYLRERLSSEEQISIVRTIAKNGRTLLNIVNDILDLSKIESEGFKYVYTLVDFRDFMQEIIESLQIRAQEKQLYLHLKIAPNMPVQLSVDKQRLQQVCMNLIVNAIKFTDVGGVVVRASYIYDTNQLMISVVDSGRGIAAEKQDQLFKRFAQVHIGHGGEGTGLGLLISRQLCEGMGGTLILAHSAENVGSEFLVSLPAPYNHDLASSNANQPLLKQVDSEQKRDLAAIAERQLRTCFRVLLVDDSQDVRDLIHLYLKQLDFSVDCASNGDEGLKLAEKNNYDLVLMDLQMPGVDGYEATKMLREKHYSKPIIALSAAFLDSDLDRARANGCTDFLMKPINRSEFESKIAEYLH